MDQTYKYDSGKLRWDLLDLNLLEGVVAVLTYGASKYSEHSWKKLDNGTGRYYAAFMRHFKDAINNIELDQESGLAHIDHAITNLLFLKYFLEQNIEKEKMKC